MIWQHCKVDFALNVQRQKKTICPERKLFLSRAVISFKNITMPKLYCCYENYYYTIYC